MRTYLKIFFFFFVFTVALQAQAGSVTGRVSNGSVPLVGFVEVYKVGSYQEGYVQQEIFTVGSDGVFTFSNLADGSYVIRTVGASEQSGRMYVDGVYNDKPCSVGHCDLAMGTPIVVSGGATVPGIDFVLETGSQISGQVKGAGAAFPSKLYVSIFNQSGELLSKQPTDTNGRYSFGGVARGTYYISTSNDEGFIDELYGNLPCPNDQCVKTAGTPIVISQPESATTADFDLARGGKITGIVKSVITNAGLRGVPISIYNGNGVLVSTGISGSGGVYTSDTALLDGTYFVRTNTSAFQNQLYKGGLCTAECNPLSGKAVIVSGAATVKGINFTLQHISNGPSIDLTAQWVAPDRSHPKAYTLTILNKGANTAGGFTVLVYKSPEPTLAAGARPFKKFHFDLFIRKSLRHFNFTLKRSSSAKYVIAVVDSDNVLPEKNERNNIARKAIK